MVDREQDGRLGVEDELQLVVFRVADEDFGVGIHHVREIIRVPEVTKLPEAPSHIKGVLNVRGEVIPVVDLRNRFGVQDQHGGDDARIIVVEMETGRVGLQVDSVAEVLRLPAGVVDEPPASIAGLHSEYVTGVGRLDDRLLIVLDVHRIFSSEEQIELEQVVTERA